MEHLIVIDLTKANLGTEKYLLDRAFQFFQARPEDYLVIGLADQQAFVQAGVPFLLSPDRDPLRVANLIFETLLETKRAEMPNKVTITSFHGEVFHLRDRLPPEFNGRVHVRAFRSLLPGSNTPVQRPVATMPLRRSWPAEFMSRDTALAALMEAFRRLGTSASKPARQSDLRVVLTHVDERFNKERTRNSPPGLIATLVAEAVSEGLVATRALPNDQANPYVWPIRPVGVSAPEARIQEAPAVISAPPVLPRAVKPGVKTRSDEFVAILTAHNMGPFATARERYFDELEREVAAGGTVAAVLSAAYDRVREYVERDTTLVRKNPFPWRHARRFFEKLLARRPVLLSSGQTIAPSLSTMFDEVTGLDNDWRTKLNAELLLVMMENGVTLSFDDIDSLTGALFLRRNRTNRQRVEELIRYIRREDLAELDGDRLFIKQRASEANPEPIVRASNEGTAVAVARADIPESGLTLV